jgi:hypothetical protein
VDTTGYGGRRYQQIATVITNDPDHAKIDLILRGQVRKFATIQPTRVRMAGKVGDEVTSTVTITPAEEFPFSVLAAAPSKEGNVRVEIAEDPVSEADGRKRYRLTVTNLKQERARYFDTIVLKTDSDVRPELNISVYGNIFDPPPVPPKKEG